MLWRKVYTLCWDQLCCQSDMLAFNCSSTALKCEEVLIEGWKILAYTEHYIGAVYCRCYLCNTLRSVYYTMYTVYSVHCSVLFMLWYVYCMCILYSVYCIVYSVCSVLCKLLLLTKPSTNLIVYYIAVVWYKKRGIQISSVNSLVFTLQVSK